MEHTITFTVDDLALDAWCLRHGSGDAVTAEEKAAFLQSRIMSDIKGAYVSIEVEKAAEVARPTKKDEADDLVKEAPK